MTPQQQALEGLARAARAANENLEEVERLAREALNRFARDIRAIFNDIEAEEHRRQHPRIRDNLHKINRRYRRPK